MKKTALVALTILSLHAQAADNGVVIDGKSIAIIDTVSTSAEHVIHTSDLAKGVFITVNKMTYGDVRPNTTKIVRERFAAAGIKLADAAVGSSMSLQFDAMGTLDIGDAEKALAYSAMPNAQQIAVNGGAIAAGVVNMGKAGVLGAIVGLAFTPDAKSTLMAQVYMQPHMEKGFFSGENLRSSVQDGSFIDGVRVTYKLEKGKEASDAVVLKMLVDEWIKKYVVVDAESISVSDMSATIANAKK
jgi:hypothetical protein